MAVLVMTVIKTATPATQVLQLFANPAGARYLLANLILGTAATFAAAANPLLVTVVLPGTILAYKHFTAQTPAPAATR